MSRILIIEDEKIMRVTLADYLSGAGHKVFCAETRREGVEALRSSEFDLLITDVKLPDGSGLDLLGEGGEDSATDVIVMTAYGTIKDAVAAMKYGAFDYITKPFSLDELDVIIDRATEIRELREANRRLRADVGKCYGASNIVGESPRMKVVFSLIERVMGSDATVLISGESGTGKELVASTVHYGSKRREGPFVRVNCAALPEGLIESELFGHERGAFTGAHKRKIGKFEAANGGTIFLDEIGDLHAEAQAKLLRVLQERTFERIGGNSEITVDVRVIAATNRDLAQEVGAGKFREDLYYRLNVVQIHVPPLRERKDDILPLLTFFSGKYRKKLSKETRFSRNALLALTEYDYPGNVRELENIVERCMTLDVSGTIERDDLPGSVRGEARAEPLPSLSDIAGLAEMEHIRRVLLITDGNKTRAAEMLGVSRKTLWEKLKMHKLDT